MHDLFMKFFGVVLSSSEKMDVKTYLKEGIYPNHLTRKKSLWKYSQKFSICNDQLFYKKNRKVVLQMQRKTKFSATAIQRVMVAITTLPIKFPNDLTSEMFMGT